MNAKLKQAITIQQPYAHLIAAGEKFVENRTWARGRHSWGWIGIHAGRSRQRDGECREFGLHPDDLVYGCIVAVARIAIVIHVDEIEGLINQDRESWGWLRTHKHVEGPFCWVFDRINPLDKPIAMSGSRGIWEIDWRNLMRVRREAEAWRQAHEGRMLAPEPLEV